VAVDSSNSQFVTASADSTLKVWATRDPSEEDSIEYLDIKNKKRRKTAGQDSHKIKVNIDLHCSIFLYGMLTGTV
jgi:WD40 repeat protein